MTTVAKIFAAVFALIVISRSIVDYRNRKESFEMTLFWIVIWLLISAIAFFPGLVDKAIRAFGGSRTGLGTVLGMGLVFVMFITYRVYIKANRIEKHLHEIFRKFALLDIKKGAPAKKAKRVSRDRAK